MKPQIWNAIRFGAVMENVIIEYHNSREPDFADGSFTKPLGPIRHSDFIPGAVIPSVANHPRVIIFLTEMPLG